MLKQPPLIRPPTIWRGMLRPSDNHLPKRTSNDPTNLPLIETGHGIIVLSVLFFLIFGYATFFSVFISPPPNFVRDRVNTLPCFNSSDCGKGFESYGRRHPL